MKQMLVVLAAVGLFLGGAVGLISMMPMPSSYGTVSDSQEIVAVEASPSPSPSSSPEKTQEVHALPYKEEAPKKQTMDIIQLGSKNSIVLRGAIDESTVGILQKKILQMSSRLSPKDTIYLVIDSPGGSVFDGQQFIDTVKGMPQKVKTISIFAASMAFQIVQNLDERMVTPSGTLMSHRAKVGGIGGQIGSDGKGELFSELNWLLEGLKTLDHQAASRMRMSDSEYLDLIRDEYWVSGANAVKSHAADRTVLVRCNKDLINGEDTLTLQTFFGTVQLTFSQCPMIQAPIKVDMVGVKNRKELEKFVKLLTQDKKAFVETYVVTGKLDSILLK